MKDVGMVHLSSIQEAFVEAEKQISLTEARTGVVPTPPINELRYAGSHLLIALGMQEGEERDAEMTAALNHCKRAYYDAQRFTLVHLLYEITRIKETLGEYQDFFAELVGTSYIAVKKKVIEARRYLEETVSLKANPERWEKRGEHYQGGEVHIKALQKFIHLYQTVSDELSKKIRREQEIRKEREEEKEKTKRYQAISWAVAISIGAISVAATIIAAVLS